MKWKVCGMRQTENINEIVALEPDYMGFILWDGSKRFCASVPEVPKGIAKVGVFVNAAPEEMLSAIDTYKLAAIQLHGDEPPSLCRAVQGHAQIIKAFSVGASFDFDTLIDYIPYCDFFLFDTKGIYPGGNGTTFDWTLLYDYPYDIPFFISGGIGLEEVSKIHELCNSSLPVYAVDVNSKFEQAIAVKDVAMLTDFKEKLML